MNELQTLVRLRLFLRLLAGGLFAGTIAELVLAEHVEEPIQWLPFILCGLGLLVMAWAWLRPQRIATFALIGVMVLTMGASFFGMWEHFEGNRAFTLERRPTASGWYLLRHSLQGGAPLLAPGILIVGAAVALAGTVRVGGAVAARLPQKPSGGAATPAADSGLDPEVEQILARLK